MGRITRTRRAATGIAFPLIAAGLLVTACSSSGGSSTGTGTGGGGTSGAGGLTISSAKGAAGTYLTDGSGRALYLWVADSNGKSACSGACASAWPPLTTTGTPTATGGVQAADLGTVKRSDGTEQVSYDGHPLYYFAGDSGTATSGQGSDQFGAKWWLVAPSGSAITGAPSAQTSSSAGYSNY